MREIKFRAWDFQSKQMFKVDEIRMKGNAYTVSIIGFSSKQWLTTERTAVMQFSGLKDANGKEIYEGDIVEYLYWGTKTFKEVKWQDDTSGFYPFADSPENCGCCGMGKNPKGVEVIGNIYENPELLERMQ